MKRLPVIAFGGVAILAYVAANVPVICTTFGDSNDPRKRFGSVLVVLHSHMGNNQVAVVKDGGPARTFNYDWIAIPCWIAIVGCVGCLYRYWNKRHRLASTGAASSDEPMKSSPFRP